MSSQYSSRGKGKSASPMRKVYLTAAVLLLAVYVTSMLTAAPLAKYATNVTGSDTIQVAKFGVETTAGENTSLELNTTSTEATYTFSVSNAKDGTLINEVTTDYDVVVTLPQKIDNVDLTLKNGETSVEGTTSSDGKTYTFENAGRFEPATATTQTLTLTFTLDDEPTDTVTYSDIKIDVNAVQVN